MNNGFGESRLFAYHQFISWWSRFRIARIFKIWRIFKLKFEDAILSKKSEFFYKNCKIFPNSRSEYPKKVQKSILSSVDSFILLKYQRGNNDNVFKGWSLFPRADLKWSLYSQFHTVIKTDSFVSQQIFDWF